MARAKRQEADAARGALPRVLFDTNVLLDIVLAREPWAADAVHLLDVAAKGDVEGFVAAHAVTTIHYLVQRARDARTARMAIADQLSVLQVA